MTEGRAFLSGRVGLVKGEWVKENGRVLALEQVAPGHVRADVLAPAFAARARPGQFAMVRMPGTFLGRPLSLFRIDGDRGEVAFLVRVAGRGTRIMAGCKAGETLLLTGPFGNGFPAAGPGRVLILAGGVGVAPFPPVVRASVSAGARVLAVVGARSGDLVLGVDALLEAGAEVMVCAEDGSRGKRGLVTELLPEALARMADGNGPARVYACGPAPMLAAAARALKGLKAEVYVSLEARMGCGFGVCRGCAVPGAGGGYLHVCQDGPVFPAGDVDLDGVARLWAGPGGEGRA